ncbi:hypothetical protein ACA910_018486 [Epithemia clementina (nom. ined.)]
MGRAGEDALSNRNIIAMQESPVWRCQYSKFLMKKIKPAKVIEQKRKEWFCNFKVGLSNPLDKMGRGKEDLFTGKKLFTLDKTVAVMEQKKNAVHIQDTLPLDKMYRLRLFAVQVEA